MSRAQRLLVENAEMIDTFIQQMNDFAERQGGYINRSGVGNWRGVDEQEGKKMSKKRQVARAAGLATAGAGAAHLLHNATNDGLSRAGNLTKKLADPSSPGLGGQIAKKVTNTAGGFGTDLRHAAKKVGSYGSGGGENHSILQQAGKGLKSAAKQAAHHFNIGP